MSNFYEFTCQLCGFKNKAPKHPKDVKSCPNCHQPGAVFFINSYPDLKPPKPPKPPEVNQDPELAKLEPLEIGPDPENL